MSLDTYVKGTKCWFTDEKEGWISASLTTKDVGVDGKVTITFTDDTGKVLLPPLVDVCLYHKHDTAQPSTYINRTRPLTLTLSFRICLGIM
jgi:hypothetical protein